MERLTLHVLHVLSAGAAQGLVAALSQRLRRETGAEIDASFGAVGAMRAKLIAGAPCDLVILSRKLIAELVAAGKVLDHTVADLGEVRTGIAVRARDPTPEIHDANALRAALRTAGGIYFPDPQRATAGIHFAAVLERLGIADEVAARVHTFPNGATAMRALAQAQGERLIGCTQNTEIRNTRGVQLVGDLPDELGLVTRYSLAVTANAGAPAQAREFAALLTGESSRALRLDCGFEL